MKIQIKPKKENAKTSFADAPYGEGNNMPIQQEWAHNSHSKKNKSKITNFLISLSLVFLFLGIPLFFTNITLQGMGFDKQIYFYFWLLVGVIAWVFKGVSDGEIIFKRSPLDIPIIAFLSVSLISSIYSVNKWDSFLGAFSIPHKGFIGILAGAVFYWFLISNITEKRLRMILRAVMVAAGIVGLFMAMKFAGIGEIIISKWNIPKSLKFLFAPGFNTIGLMGGVAIFLAASLILVITNFKFQILNFKKISNIKYQIFQICKLLLSFVAVYVILSLLNYINLYVLLIPFVIIIVFSVSKIISISKVGLYFAIILFGVILLMSIVSISPKMARIDLPAEVGLSQKTSWNIATQAIKENWAFGTGPATFKYAFSKYRPQSLNLTALWQTKFSEAGLLAETVSSLGVAGIISLAVMILVFVGVCIVVVSNFKFSASESQRRYGQISKKYQTSNIQNVNNNRSKTDYMLRVILGLFASSILLVLYCLFSLSSVAIILFTVMITSLAIAAVSLISPNLFKEYVLSYESSPQYALAMSFIFVCLISGAVVLFALLGKVFIADVYARQALVQNNFDQAAAKMGRAASLANFQDEYLARLGDINIKRAVEKMSESVKANNQKDKNELRESARQLFISALDAHKLAAVKAPMSSDIWESFAVAAETVANYDPTLLDDVISAYEKTAELNPTNPLIYIRLAKLKIIMADAAISAKKNEKSNNTKSPEATKLYREAKDCYNKAIELKKLREAYEGLATAEQRLGNIAKTIEIYNMLLSSQPKSEIFPYNLARVYENKGDKENAIKYYEMTLENIGDRKGGEEVKKAVREKILNLNNKESAKLESVNNEISN